MLENEGATPDIEDDIDELSMDDTIRDAMAQIRERGVEETDDARTFARDEAGRFAATEEAQAASAPAPEGVTAPEASAEPVAPEAPPEAAAPGTWKKEVAAKWSTLPPDVQQEILRREDNIHAGIAQYRDAAQFAHQLRDAITPHIETLRSLNIAPDRAVAELFKADARLRFGSPEQKAANLVQMAQAYGIDIGQAQNYQPQAVDPTVDALQRQVQEMYSHLQQQQMMGQEQEDAALNSDIAAFAADPNHGHFDAVRQHMAALIQAGLASSLGDAYAQAVYANPTTRAAVTAQQQRTQREENAKRAHAARNAASVNIRRSPAYPAETAAGQTMDDTIRTAFRQIVGA